MSKFSIFTAYLSVNGAVNSLCVCVCHCLNKGEEYEWGAEEEEEYLNPEQTSEFLF